jgi:hypothetical protein
MLIASLLALALTAQPGVPETPPRTDPNIWVTWGNDWFGIVGTPTDDHRTNEMSAGFRSHRLVVMVDDSMLTLFDDADVDRQHGVRMDEATITVGYASDLGITAGGGIRYKGDAGGEGLQNWWHGLLNDNKVHGEYESDGVVAVCYGLWKHDYGRGTFFPETIASATVTSDAELAADVAGRLVFSTDNDATFWAGLRYQIRAGDFSTKVAAATAEFERGLVYEFGFSLGRTLSFQSGYIVHDRSAVGAFTYTYEFGDDNDSR